MAQANAEKEYTVHDELARLDPSNQYFLYPKRLCSVDTAALTPANRIDNCGLSNPSGSPLFRRNLSNARIVEYPDGGVDLLLFKLKQNNYYQYFKGFENLLEGLVLLHAAGYVHFDIKQPNVVAKKMPMDHRGNQPIHMRFIDFGFLSKAETLRRVLPPTTLESMYVVWPPDMLFTSVSGPRPSKINDSFQASFYLDQHYQSAQAYYVTRIPTPSWMEIFNISHQKWKEMFAAFWALGDGANACTPPKPFEDRQDCGHFGIDKAECEGRGCCFDPNPSPNPSNVPYCYRKDDPAKVQDNERLRKYLPTVDIFSLGILMSIEFAQRIGLVWKATGIRTTYMVPPANQAWVDSVARRIAVPFYELIAKMIRMDFRRRISAQQALDEYRTILPVMEELFTTENIRNHLAASFAIAVPSPPPSPPTPSGHRPLQRQLGVRRLIGGKTKKRKNRS